MVHIESDSIAGLTGVIEDDFPAALCLLKDQRKDSFGVSARACAARQMEAAGDGGVLRVELIHFQSIEGELAHLFFSGVDLLIASEDGSISMLDCFADEGSGWGVFVPLHEGGDIAAIPCRDLRVEDAANRGLVRMAGEWSAGVREAADGNCEKKRARDLAMWVYGHVSICLSVRAGGTIEDFLEATRIVRVS